LISIAHTLRMVTIIIEWTESKTGAKKSQTVDINPLDGVDFFSCLGVFADGH